MVRTLCFALLLGCAAEPLDCAHGMLEQTARGGRRMDLLILVDGASFSAEARPHVERAVSSFVASSLVDRRAEELYAGVVVADGCDDELGQLAPPTAECPAPGEAAMTWSAAREIPPDEIADGLGCRAGAMIGRGCAWDPAAALERVIEERALPRTSSVRLQVLLVSAGDVPDPEALARALADREIAVTFAGGIRAFELDPRAVDPSGCEGVIDATPAAEVVAMLERLLDARRVRRVGYASVCSSDWSAAPSTSPVGDGIHLGCLARAPVVDDDGLARCEVVEVLPARSVVERCDELPGRELIDASDLSRCRIRQGDGFVLGPPSSDRCAAELYFDVQLAAGVDVHLRCQTELSDPVDCRFDESG